MHTTLIGLVASLGNRYYRCHSYVRGTGCRRCIGAHVGRSAIASLKQKAARRAAPLARDGSTKSPASRS
jgi:hypothetical protein